MGTLHKPNREDAKRFASASIYSEQAVNQLLNALISIPDPDEVLAKAGLSRTELRKLDGDDEITAAADTRCEAVIATPWHLERDGNPATDTRSEFVREILEPWVETMARAAWAAVPYGYSVWETVYARDSGLIVFERIEEKPFEWFKPVRNGKLLYYPVNKPQGEEVDHELKFFLTVRQPSYRQPYGKALYSRLYWPWFFRNQGWKFWMQNLERWGTPFLVGHTSGNADTMAKQLAKMVKNAVGAVGMDDKVEVVQAAGLAHFETFERAVTARVQKVILGQTLTTDAGGSSGKSGSFALGKVHNEVRQDRRNADLRLITTTIQRQINALWKVNGFADVPPSFKFQDDTGLQTDRAERDAKLMQAGVQLSPEYFKRVYDFEDDEVDGVVVNGATVGDGTGTAGDGTPAPGKKKPAVKAAREGDPRFTREQQAVEDLIAAASQQLTSPVDPEAIKNAIKAARDPDDLAERLALLFADSDRVSFGRVLERCLFAADVMGYAHAG